MASHLQDDFVWHKTTIDHLRDAARRAGKRLTIIADLPDPKMRIGELAEEPITLQRGDAFTLTTSESLADGQFVFVDFPRLPKVVKPGGLECICPALGAKRRVAIPIRRSLPVKAKTGKSFCVTRS